jgi:hypothetical protein
MDNLVWFHNVAIIKSAAVNIGVPDIPSTKWFQVFWVNILKYLGRFCGPIWILGFFSIPRKKWHWNFDRIALNLLISLVSMNMIIILIITIQKYGLSLHLLAVSISFIYVLWFLVYMSLTSLIEYIPVLIFCGYCK